MKARYYWFCFFFTWNTFDHVPRLSDVWFMLGTLASLWLVSILWCNHIRESHLWQKNLQKIVNATCSFIFNSTFGNKSLLSDICLGASAVLKIPCNFEVWSMLGNIREKILTAMFSFYPVNMRALIVVLLFETFLTYNLL